jgi:hypothetical protein
VAVDTETGEVTPVDYAKHIKDACDAVLRDTFGDDVVARAYENDKLLGD